MLDPKFTQLNKYYNRPVIINYSKPDKLDHLSVKQGLSLPSSTEKVKL